jgi:hypothetical protein
MKKKLPIVHKSAPGAFAATLHAADEIVKKFRTTNLDLALHKGIEDGWLFVMPAGSKFAYCRGTGPIGFRGVRLGSHEGQDPKTGMPIWSSPRFLDVTYSIMLVDEEGDDRRIEITIPVPSRFVEKYVERSQGVAHAPHLTRLEFVYKADDLRIWMREFQMDIYGRAERACHERIRDTKKLIEQIRGMARGEIGMPHQSPFGE